ncbi:MAG: alanine--tRNA ligase [Desulfovibrio sp.]|nr:alanine--tRNA ligase [Desulfovibrio sp.]
MLTASEIRQRYLDFFGKRMHQIVPSGPLIPPDDPSLLFTNAGMVQFKQYFLGDPDKPFSRATTCQKCLRVSGKHNDLENVGRTARHHTFFEMLGNFSFGDYFKREAIAWAWEFVTEELGLPPEKLWVTIYKDDDEAAAIWKEVAGLPDERIVRMGEKDNFWTMGDTGPCGPCSEIYIDQGEELGCGEECGIGKCDCDRFLEIWNLVFTQFDQSEDGSRALLAAPNIDTGMGLERIAAVCQGRNSNFDCDLFQDIIQYAASLANVEYSASAPDTNDIDTALRVIADHARAAAFLISENVLPSNESRGYVLRRLIRRALRFATLMGVREPILHKVAVKVTETMGDAYPELRANADFIGRVVLAEERKFAQTLENGLQLLSGELDALEARGEKLVPGDFCFRLYDTYGFPLDIVRDVAEKRGFGVDEKGFEEKMLQQRERARSSQKKAGLLGQGGLGVLQEACKKLVAAGIRTRFTGYDSLETDSEILCLLNEHGEMVEMLEEGERGYLVAAQTPFYGESGGQAGDTGHIRSSTGAAFVEDALKPVPEIILHLVRMDAGEFSRGGEIRLAADSGRRMATARNHTCTHLLHAALRRCLGTHVKQAGSSVDAERLRFDFSHPSALSAAELAEVERDVNRAIMADAPVCATEMAHAEAIARGAMALFNEKYGERVRVLTIGDDPADPESVELCGGTHLRRTGEAGSFLITAESAVAAGIRRIEAVSGWGAYNYAIQERATLKAVAAELKTGSSEAAPRAKALQEELKRLRKQSEKAAAADVSAPELARKAKAVNGIQALGADLGSMPVRAMRKVMDDLRGLLPKDGVIMLASRENGKAALLIHVSRNLHGRLTAPDLIRDIAAICGGSGGGRPDLAQAGGDRPDQIGAALDKFWQLLEAGK